MQSVSDPADKKIVEAVKETVEKEAHKAAEAGVKEAKEDVAAEEKAKS